MKDTTLVIMAAGIGSRFGGGIKQLEPVGPAGEIIMDYSIHDALEAGFNKIVFIIRKDLEKDFKEIIGRRIEKIADVSYAFQELDDLPEGFTKPADRTKPWGTGQAILCCKGLLNDPFIVINADDYYGKEAFVKIHDYLENWAPVPGKFNFCMAGFILGNTLSDNGGVTRGVCNIDQNYHLVDVDETSDIIKTKEGAAICLEDGTQKPIDAKSYVSMNMWGFTPDLLDELETGFAEFLSGIKEGDLKKEYLLPIIVDQMIKSGKAQVTLLETNDKWFGVTYKEDKDTVVASFRKLIADGVYSNPLLR
ncbi:nucleotidyltransferase family protein [Robinsoniella peoriensis]|uniref:nucleotidyltransferase family protein n=1 Tax=Robinsoniella peoriensis TaxID=180332 RepID=UPI0005C7DD28|nr:sugar phosphate nucleotidyltransferase [Robinsoniella peoriensis]